MRPAPFTGRCAAEHRDNPPTRCASVPGSVMHPTPPYGEPQGRDGGTAAFTLSGRYAGDSLRTPSGQSGSLRGLE